MESSAAKRIKLSTSKDSARTTMDLIKDFYRLDTSDFSILANKPWYVDKTLFIKTALTDADKILITAPRRFGKSTNMDMLKRFLEIKVDECGEEYKIQTDEAGELKSRQFNANFKLFKDKNIFINEKAFFNAHFSTYPVICTDFECVDGSSYDDYLETLRLMLHETYKCHDYLLTSLTDSDKFNRYYDQNKYMQLTEAEIEAGLVYLAECLYTHFDNKRVYVLIDEFDAPITSAMHNSHLTNNAVENIIKLIRTLITNLLDNNRFVHKALFSACNHVGSLLLPSNIKHYPFLSQQYGTCYGFTKTEIKHLLPNLSVEQTKEVDKWFDGYTTTDSNGSPIEIYNNWSIRSYLNNSEIDNYWASGYLRRYKKLLLHNEIEAKIQELMYGNSVAINYIHKMDPEHVINLKRIFNNPSLVESEDVDLFIQFLYENGYCNIKSKSNTRLVLAMPNMEIHNEYRTILFSLDVFIKRYNIDERMMDKCVDSLLSLSRNKTKTSITEFAQNIKAMYNNSSLKPRTEFEFHAHLFCLLWKRFPDIMGETVSSPEQKFLCDIAAWVEKDKTGIIFELKLGANAESSKCAVKQILQHKYYTIFKKEQYATISNKILIGMHMNECKEITISYLISNCDDFDENKIETVTSH